MRPVALITGGQRGIGLGIAVALKDAGFGLAIAAEKPEEDEEITDALQALGGAASYHQHDLRNAGETADLVDAVETALGPIATLILNAGVPAPTRGDVLDITLESFDLVMDVNLRGGFFLAQEVARRMLNDESEHYRSIHFVTSVSAEMASTERAEYCVSKAGASMAARLFSLRLAEAGIGVFELRPGIIETRMTAAVAQRYDGLIRDGLVPARRWGTPEDIADVAVSLATGRMAFATGAVIPVDGGLSIHRL
ncbi:MAG: 3-ketoacyl-ACP reductase [Pseudomonadota bacterium]